jgi:hypothetical protein
VLPWLVASTWLAITAYGLWHFTLEEQRPLETVSAADFDADARRAAATAWFKKHLANSGTANGASATVVHILRPDCPCNRFTDPHLRQIVARYSALGVHFILATRQPPPTQPQITISPGDLPSRSRAHETQSILVTDPNELSWVTASPAALVFDATGALVYFGPYSDAARCGTSGGLVERVLDKVLAGHSPQLQRFIGGGCFCGWSDVPHARGSTS